MTSGFFSSFIQLQIFLCDKLLMKHTRYQFIKLKNVPSKYFCVIFFLRIRYSFLNAHFTAHQLWRKLKKNTCHLKFSSIETGLYFEKEKWTTHNMNKKMILWKCYLSPVWRFRLTVANCSWFPPSSLVRPTQKRL